MILKKDLFKRPFKISDEHEANVEQLLINVNKLMLIYGHDFTVTSGYRTLPEHLAIYKAKGITDQSKIPMKSLHLSGQAVDVVPHGLRVSDLQSYIKDHIRVCEEIGLWFEDFKYTPTWVHIQIVPPKSGNRFFVP